MVGTPEKLVTRSRSISSSARPASHLCIRTILPPTSVHGWSRQLLAVTWNNGVGAMNTGREPGSPVGVAASSSPASTALASAIAETMFMNARFNTLCTDPRCVSWAPFGKPVVPEV